MHQDLWAGIETDRPWQTGLTSAGWLEQPTAWFFISELILTQEGVFFAALACPRQPIGGDPYPHVVIYQGRQFLEDGHSRLMRALLRSETQIQARFITL